MKSAFKESSKNASFNPEYYITDLILHVIQITFFNIQAAKVAKSIQAIYCALKRISVLYSPHNSAILKDFRSFFVA